MAKKKTKKQWRGCDARGEERRTAPHERTALKGRGPGIWVWPGGVHSSKGQGLPKQTNKQGYQYQYCVNSARPITAVRLQYQGRWEERRVPGQALRTSFTLVSSHNRVGGKIDTTAANATQM